MPNPSIISIVDSVDNAEPASLQDIDAVGFKKLLMAKGELFWAEQGARKALRLFHEAAARVPAYKDFLKRAHVDPKRIKTIGDFAQAPVTSAENYIAAYPLEARCWDGKLTGTQLIAASSGTKGEPKFWPRNARQDFEQALVHEFLYRTYFQFDKRTTLLLIGFPMGIYISGMATVLPSWLASFKHAGLTVMSVGNNKAEMLRAVKNLSHAYDQTVLVGHPFYIKDVIETGTREGIAWSRKRVGMMFCSEGFTEAWRDYIAKKAGMPKASARIFNTYGSSEMLLMAYETSASIAVKRTMEQDPDFLRSLMDDPVAPQLFQYNPLLRYIESIDKELVFTSTSGVPLIRFNLHDRGTVLPLRQVANVLRARGKSAILRPVVSGHGALQLPFVALWGRSDHALKFHGANIYPEHVKIGLADRRFLDKLTGKFTIRKFLSRNMDQFLEINIELCPGVRERKSLKDDIQASIVKTLLMVNLEYKDMSGHIKKDVRPRVVLRPYQYPRYFKPGLKPRYIDPS